MASKRRQRRRACDGKEPHETLAQAQIEAARLKRVNPGEIFDAYHCRKCGKYHTGHQTARVARAITSRRRLQEGLNA